MSQSNPIILNQPQRQSPVAIILVIVKAFFNIIRQLWPVLVLFVLGKSSSSFNSYILYVFIGITIISTVYSIINYFRTYFYVKNNELVVTSGILSSKKVSIPAERIQSINLEQNVIHRIFNVQRLKIDTAGSSEKEVEISAVSMEMAEALRQSLLAGAKALPKKEDATAVKEKKEQQETILQLTIGHLIKNGLLENHLKSGWFIFVFAWWMYTNLQEVGIDAEDYIEQYSAFVYGLTIIASLVVVFIVVSILISLIRTVVRFYNLHFMRTEKGFKITHGLLNTQTVSALDKKIQTVSWSDNLLKQLFKIFDLKLKQASSKEVVTKQAIVIPGCNQGQIDHVINYLYPYEIKEELILQSVHPSYLNRALFFSILIPLIPLVIGIIITQPEVIAIAIAFLIYLPLVSYLKFKKLRYGFNSELIRIKGGVFGDKNIITPIYKIQAIEKSQSPFERSRGLVSITIYNASGSETIPFIPEPEAHKMTNIFLKKVETTHLGWM